MAFELPPLPFAPTALEPYYDARTIEIHHGKHHAAYTTNFNKALEGQKALLAKPAEDILRNLEAVPQTIRQAVINHGGGYVNHNLFWKTIGPKAGGTPVGSIGDAIKATFGGFDAFKDQFTKAAMGQFGSGWAWLSVDQGGKLQVCALPNQESPLSRGQTPILTLDVWEHAYYLQYQNRRADWITAWWNIVNWRNVDELYNAKK